MNQHYTVTSYTIYSFLTVNEDDLLSTYSDPLQRCARDKPLAHTLIAAGYSPNCQSGGSS